MGVPGTTASNPTRRRRPLRRAVLALIACALAGAWFASRLHGELVHPRPSKLILDRRGAYLGEVPGQGEAFGYWELPYVLPERIVTATIDTEDRQFYRHPGVHLPSVARAVIQNVKNVRIISGASTLAMQVARMQAPGERTVLRKATEAAEALLLVHRHGHEQVLRQYLTLAPYGNRAHGIVRASRLYFDKPVEDLSWKQAAFLAALPQLPGRMNPYSADGLKRATRRAERILRRLRERGLIPELDLQQALSSDLGLVPRPRREPAALHAVLAWSGLARNRPENISMATLDLGLQSTVSRILRDNLARQAWAGAGNTAGMVVDTTTGEILAYVGSKNFFDEDGRGAIDYVQVKRSPGSALKPFLYGLALESGKLTAATELADTPMDLQTDSGRAYLPQNMGHGYLGPMLAREALGNSRNIPALRVLAQVGVEPALRYFERAGVTDISWEPNRYGLALAIGNLHVTLEELTGLYGALARDGQSLPLRRFIDEPRKEGVRLLGPEAAQLVRHMLSDASARRPTFTAGGPLDYPYAVAVKTGTSQGFRDAWTVAFSDRLLVAVWVGNHDWRRMNGVTGGGGAGPAVHEILDALMPLRAPHLPVLDAFAPPHGATTATICPLSGRLAGPDCPAHKSEVFFPGSAPFQACPFHARVLTDKRNGLRAGPGCPPAAVTLRPMLVLPEEYQAWAREQRLELAPERESPLCPTGQRVEEPTISIREPKKNLRFLFDPDTPREASTLLLAARVSPATEEIVWLVDGVPFAKVGYPHEIRWPLTPGRHQIIAAMARGPQRSRPVTVVVED